MYWDINEELRKILVVIFEERIKLNTKIMTIKYKE